MTSVSGAKRSISQVLDEEIVQGSNSTQDLEPPKRRRRVDNDANQHAELTTPHPKTPDSSASEPKKRRSNLKESAFLDYRTLSSRPTSVPFQQPSQLISYSYTPDHVQEFTDSALRYFVDPPLGANLSYGYDRWIKKPDERGRLDALLKAISKAKSDGENKGFKFPEIGIISWRGVMTKILTAVYETRDEFQLNVMSVKGTLYFEEHVTEEQLREKNNMEPRHRRQTYYGYAFESFSTSDAPAARATESRRKAQLLSTPLGWGGDVNTNVQWCSVVRTKLGDTRIILGGEVDCVRGRYTGKTDNFVELKTSLTIRGKQDEERFEKKLLKFYIQSFLLGVPEIIVGFRTPTGILTTVQSFKTVQIPRMVRDKPGGWDPLVCLDFGKRVVSFLNDIIQRDQGRPDTSKVWRVKFVPGSGLSVTELEPAEVAEVVNGEDRVGFLPRWYWDEIQVEDRSIDQEERKVPAVSTSSAGERI